MVTGSQWMRPGRWSGSGWSRIKKAFLKIIFREASRNGHPEASYNLAIGHLNGIDTGLEEGDHEELLRHAARHGVEGAEAVLDHVCRSGECLGDDEYFLE